MSAAPGWYPDPRPGTVGLQAYWDGTQWHLKASKLTETAEPTNSVTAQPESSLLDDPYQAGWDFGLSPQSTGARELISHWRYTPGNWCIANGANDMLRLTGYTPDQASEFGSGCYDAILSTLTVCEHLKLTASSRAETPYVRVSGKLPEDVQLRLVRSILESA